MARFVAIVNMLPIAPFDGGHVWAAVLKRWGVPEKWRNGFQAVGLMLTALLIIYSLGSDIFDLLT
jgi:membrane-associated protease RseP (regulator of RpoE activity)